MSGVPADLMVAEGHGQDDCGSQNPQRGFCRDLSQGSPAMTESEKERIARLETRIEHMAEAVDRMTSKVEELHNILNQAKGAKWAILGAASIAGFFGSKAGTWLWSSLPK